MDRNAITPEQVQQMIRDGIEVAFLDVRDRDEWEASEMVLPAAIRVPPDEVEQSLAIVPHGRTIVVYGSDSDDAHAARIAERLIDQGWDDVRQLQGGFAAWMEAGHPVEEKVQG